MKKIALIGATGIDWWQDEKKVAFVRQETPHRFEIVNYTPIHGTHSVECLVDEAYNAPFILDKVVQAERDGCEAIVIDCVCDPILDAAREVSTVPVVGPRNASLHLALILGRRFSIITVCGEHLTKCMEEGVRKEGLRQFCASIRALDMPVLEITKSPNKAQTELLEKCKEAIMEDGADVIVLGCTGLSHEVNTTSISKELGVPIIDPFIVAVRTAALLVESRLTHSKVAYPLPSKKPVNEPPSLKGHFDGFLKE